MTTPAIVIAAYNRPESLSRLFQSVGDAHYSISNIPLIISIDKSDTDEVYALAESFDWKHGDKKIIRQNDHLGLKEHILLCGDLSEQYGSIILLEDDLVISPHYYSYSQDALRFYADHPNIAGISLYSYQISENRFFPFYPHHDGSDVYFMQLPSSWGEVFTSNSWRKFRKWDEENSDSSFEKILPDYIKKWSAHSWKKRFTAYMIQEAKYFVYPHVSYSTNYGDPGVNTDRKGLFQVPLMFASSEIRFRPLEDSASVYDAWFEILPSVLKKLAPGLSAYDFSVDLHGTKSLSSLTTEFLLSSKPSKQPVLTFGNDLPEPLQNVLSANKGGFYSFGETRNFESTEIPLVDFYVNLHPIWDMVMDKYIRHFHFTRQYPKLFVGVIDDGDSYKRNQSLKSIFSQSYPESQLQVALFHEEEIPASSVAGFENTEMIKTESREDFFGKLRDKIETSNAEYFVLLRCGDTFYDHAFEAANTIFKRYPDLNWLTGIETIRTEKGFSIYYGNTATRRWNEHIYERNMYKNLTRYIPPAATFWKQYTYQQAKPYLNFVSQKNFFEDLWQAFFKVQSLYTCDVYLSSTPNSSLQRKKSLSEFSPYLLVEDRWYDKVYEFLFVNNVPYLRMYYKTKNDLPPVVRFEHKTRSYYLSDY